MIAPDIHILSIDTTALDSMSMADLYVLHQKLNQLACDLHDGHVADGVCDTWADLCRYIQSREALTLEDLLWKWVALFGAALPRDDEDLAQFTKEARRFLGGEP